MSMSCAASTAQFDDKKTDDGAVRLRSRYKSSLNLTPEDRAALSQLRSSHITSGTDAALTRRMNAILLKAEGYTNSAIASELCASRESVSHWSRRFQEGGVEALQDRQHGGSAPQLSHTSVQELLAQFAAGKLRTAREAAVYVRSRWGVSYTNRGMQVLL